MAIKILVLDYNCFGEEAYLLSRGEWGRYDIIRHGRNLAERRAEIGVFAYNLRQPVLSISYRLFLLFDKVERGQIGCRIEAAI